MSYFFNYRNGLGYYKTITPPLPEKLLQLIIIIVV